MVATVTRLKAAAATLHYFESDGYYTRNDPEHRKASGWYGEGAAALGLRGRVKAKRFEALLLGYVPGTGRRLGRLRDDEFQHAPGVDLTFSAPKSFSLEALVYASPRTRARLLRVHAEAVRATCAFAERESLETRGHDPATGRRPRVKAHGMVAAHFRHEASRNLDPQLHTHVVVFNMTRDGAGEWRSAEFTRLERSRLLLGAFYRNELRKGVEALGYATRTTLVGRVAGFEIAGYPRSLLDAFSTRRLELLDYMRARGWENTPARAQQAALYTRRRKAEPERQRLFSAWRARSLEVGAPDREAARGRGVSAVPPSRAPLSALEVVRRAVEHLEERRTVFSANGLRAHALAEGGGRHSLGALDEAISKLRRDGHLIEATARRADLAFVTDRARDAERDLVDRVRQGMDAGSALAPAAAVETGLAAAGLNLGQREAARLLLLSSHRTVGVQGHAGSGKTAMLRTVAALAGGRAVVGLAPSASAARVLASEADIPARTLQGFLTRYRDVGNGAAGPERMAQARQALGGALLVLDEASMVGTTSMRALFRIVGAAGVERLALVGDRRQLRAVEAGQPFGLLQDAGMPTARMDEVLRQRDAGLKAAVLHMVEANPRLAVEELGNGVLEMDGDELGDAAARLWLDLDPGLRAGTAILAPTHALRAEINAAVRHGLAEEGVLRGPELELERYVNLHLTRAQKGDAANYRPGDVAVFHHDVYGVGAKAGEAWRVVEAAEGAVRLARPDGREREVDPGGYLRYRLDLFETVPMVIRAGDQVRWTRNDPARGLVNGERAEVRSIGRRNVRLRTDRGDLVLARGDPQLHHLDHAYSSTVHAAQGATFDRAIAIIDSDRGALTDQATFYVELTRARDSVVVLTDDREALVETLETATGEELSALKAVGEQFTLPPEPALRRPFRRKARLLDDRTRERRRNAGRFVGEALEAARSSIRERDAALFESFASGEHLPRVDPAWRDGARRALAASRQVLEDRETYAKHLARLPGAAEELEKLAGRLDDALTGRRPRRARRRERERRMERGGGGISH